MNGQTSVKGRCRGSPLGRLASCPTGRPQPSTNTSSSCEKRNREEDAFRFLCVGLMVSAKFGGRVSADVNDWNFICIRARSTEARSTYHTFAMCLFQFLPPIHTFSSKSYFICHCHIFLFNIMKINK